MISSTPSDHSSVMNRQQHMKQETGLPRSAPVTANSTKRYFIGISTEGPAAKKAKTSPVGINVQSLNQSKSSWWKFGDYQRDLIREMASKSPTPPATSQSASGAPVPADGTMKQQTASARKNLPFPMTEVRIQTPMNASMPRLADNQLDYPAEQEDAAGSESDGGSVATGDDSALRFRAYQAENWTEKYEELIEFRNRLGHCLVPNHFEENPTLAQWVKRQRYQYKLKLLNRRSTMSDERVQALEDIGFVWDSHSAAWDERLDELIHYKDVNGHCNVPSRYADNRQLAIWVKRQRRQYKFHCEGKPSSMTQERIDTLNSLGFQWDMRVNGKN